MGITVILLVSAPERCPMKRKYSHIFNRVSLTSLFLLFALSACSTEGIETEAEYHSYKDEFYKYGSLTGGEGGWDILGGDEEKKNYNGLGVNGYLWRAALDTVAFMPIATADPFGGVITTDWYSAPEAPAERVKLNIFILDRDLRADGVKVTVFKQQRGLETKEWGTAAVAPTTASSLEETILTRARQLRLAQRERDEK